MSISSLVVSDGQKQYTSLVTGKPVMPVTLDQFVQSAFWVGSGDPQSRHGGH
jgi:hypothetical protein